MKERNSLYLVSLRKPLGNVNRMCDGLSGAQVARANLIGGVLVYIKGGGFPPFVSWQDLVLRG